MRSTRIAAIAAVSSLAGGLLATAAGATFNDVNEDGQFAEHITNVQEAGIATGYGDGSFRPTNPINRQQAAAWIDRAATRSALDFANEPDELEPVTPGDAVRVLATVEVTSPADDVGGGWVNLEGYVAAATQDPGGEGCPCAVDIIVRNGDGEIVAVSAATIPGPESDDERTWIGPVAINPLAGIVALPGGTTESFTLEVELKDSDVGPVQVAGTLSALYTPMAEGDPTTYPEAVSLVPGP